MLDKVAEAQLRDGGEPPLRQDLLAGEPRDKIEPFNAALSWLADSGYVEVGGHSGRQEFYLGVLGIVACRQGEYLAGVTARLLGFLHVRAAVPKFREYTWDDLKQSKAVSGDEDFGAVVLLIDRFGLANWSNHSRMPVPTGTWGVPSSIVELQKVDSLDDLILFAKFTLKEGPRSSPPSSSVRDAPSQGEAMRDRKKVFIIHGQNEAAVIAVEHFVKALGLQPIRFEEVAATKGGMAFIGDIVEAGLEQAETIIALFTPDEYAALVPGLRGQTQDEQRWQARPNVIFEAGMAFMRARERSILVTVGDVGLPSDMRGVHEARLTNSSKSRGNFRQKLIGIAKEAVDQTTDAWTDMARSGDFEGCLAPVKGAKPKDPFVEPGGVCAGPRPALSLSRQAEAAFAIVRNRCLTAGHSDYESHNFVTETYEERRAFRELERHGFVKANDGGGQAWRLTDLGVDMIVADREAPHAYASTRWDATLGSGASGLMDGIQHAYLAGKFPNYKAWHFGPQGRAGAPVCRAAGTRVHRIGRGWQQAMAAQQHWA